MSGFTCKGSYLLGTACGVCSRCQSERETMTIDQALTREDQVALSYFRERCPALRCIISGREGARSFAAEGQGHGAFISAIRPSLAEAVADVLGQVALGEIKAAMAKKMPARNP